MAVVAISPAMVVMVALVPPVSCLEEVLSPVDIEVGHQVPGLLEMQCSEVPHRLISAS